MPTVIASIALVAIVGWAIFYMYKKKHRGSVCIGCSLEEKCPVTQMYGTKPLLTIQHSAHSGSATSTQVAASVVQKRRNTGGCGCGCS